MLSSGHVVKCNGKELRPITNVRTSGTNEEIRCFVVFSFGLLFSSFFVTRNTDPLHLFLVTIFALSSSTTFRRSRTKMSRDTYKDSAQDQLSKNSLLCPVITLVLWSFVMMIWLYVKRIPAFNRINFGGKNPNQLTKSQFDALLPAEVRWPADNYNHLMEQPTLFYAVVGILAVTNDRDKLNLLLAWAYVLLRIVHSVLQAAYNLVWWRFTVFIIASVPLFMLSVRTAFLVFLG